MPEKHLRREAESYLHWYSRKLLPFWRSSATDPNGGVYERLLADGSPDQLAARRLRVQARFAYSFARAEALGLVTETQPLFEHAFVYMQDKAFGISHPQSFDGAATLLDNEGEVIDPTTTLYDLSVIFLACVWASHAYKDETYFAWARATLSLMENKMFSNRGGWHASYPSSSQRLQNPHMHWLECFLDAYELTGEQVWKLRADSIYDLFVKRFLDEENGVVREVFLEGWGIDPEAGNDIEPGHMMEWCCLLGHYAELTNTTHGPLITSLFDVAERKGRIAGTPFLTDAFDIRTGKQKSSARSWVQMEYIKASLMNCTIEAYDTCHQTVALIKSFRDVYLAPALEGGHFDTEIATDKMQTSTLYHFTTLAVVMQRWLSSYRAGSVSASITDYHVHDSQE